MGEEHGGACVSRIVEGEVARWVCAARALNLNWMSRVRVSAEKADVAGAKGNDCPLFSLSRHLTACDPDTTCTRSKYYYME